MDIKDDESGGTPLRGSQGSSAAVGNADTSIGNMSGLELCIGDNSVSVELDGLDPQKRELLEARLMGRQPGQMNFTDSNISNGFLYSMWNGSR